MQRVSILASAIILMVFAFFRIDVSAFAPASDPEAVRMARTMMAAMGDRQLWANATWMYVKESAHYSTRPGPAVAEYWRRFDEPGYWGRVEGPEVSVRSGWDRRGGWTFRNGTMTELNRERLQEQVGWWPREIYTMYHRLAKEDRSLRLHTVAGSPKRFLILDDATAEDLCWFEVDGDGGIVKWHTRFGTSEVEYVYGPLKQFGPIRMPAWGTLVNGSFRFSYEAAELRASPPVAPFPRP
jgi:hypothetical protein